jgi:hypothetical protein
MESVDRYNVIIAMGARLRVCATVAANWPTVPIVYPSDDTRVRVEQLWNDTDREKQKDLEKNLSQDNFNHHKSHMDCPGR